MTKIDPNTLNIRDVGILFDAFERAGHQLFYVGGCVRNAVMGAAATDIDMATNAWPETTREIGHALGLNVIATGEEHGTLTLMIGGNGYEITTFRNDISTDGRRATVAYSTSMIDDAKRRDFTMNALYADKTGQVLDPLGGLQDVVDRRVRFIGNAADRIREDYLRILRFFRFYGWYSDPHQGVDATGLAACSELSDGLGIVSKERIGAELVKLLAAKDPAPAMSSMNAAGILVQILPGASVTQLSLLTHFDKDVPINPWRRLAMIGGQNVQDNLRLSKSQARLVEKMSNHARETDSPFAMGFYLGRELGWDAWLIRSALMEMPPLPVHFEHLDRGAAAEFPIGARDLDPKLKGKEIGRALQVAQAHWLASDAQLDRASLLKYLNQT